MDTWEGKEFVIMLDFAGRISGVPKKLPPTVAGAVEAKMGRPLPEACSLKDAQRIESVIKTLLKGGSVGPTQTEFESPGSEKIECTLRFERLNGPDEKMNGLMVFGLVGMIETGVLGKLSSRVLSQLLESARNFALIAEPLPLAFNIAAGAKKLAGADIAAVYLKDEITGLLRVAGHAEMPSMLVPKAIHEGEGLIGKVTERGEAILARRRPDVLPADDPAASMDCKSYMYVPLRCEGVRLGALCVFAKDEARFAETEEELIYGLAEIASAAILRTRLKKGLTESETVLRAALNGVTVGVLATDHEGRIAHLNPEFLIISRMRAASAEDVVGRNLFSTQIVLKNRLSEKIVKVLEGDRFDFDRPEFILADDSRAPIRIQGRALTDGERVLGALLVMRELEIRPEAVKDIADEKPAEHRIEDSIKVAESNVDEQYWSFFEDSGDGILIFSADGDIIDLNDAATRILALDKKEILGEPLRSIFPQEKAAAGPPESFRPYRPLKDGGQSQLFFGAPGFQKRILLAEDDDGEREFCRKILTDAGYDVTVAEDGQEALDIFKAENGRFDLVMLDMVMPGLNGESAFRKMRVYDPGTKAVLCTGYAEQIKEMRDADLGPVAYVEKPYEAVQLCETVAKALAKSSPGKP